MITRSMDATLIGLIPSCCVAESGSRGEVDPTLSSSSHRQMVWSIRFCGCCKSHCPEDRGVHVISNCDFSLDRSPEVGLLDRASSAWLVF